MAIHDPTRACPPSSACASIVRPSAAPAEPAARPDGRRSRGTGRDQDGERIGRRARRRAVWAWRAAGDAHGDSERDGSGWRGRSKDVSPRSKVAQQECRPARPARPDGRAPAAAIVRCASSRHPSARRRHPEGPVPEIRPFRALRYDPADVGDLAAVVAPPYDVIGPDEHERLAGPPSRQRRPARPARRTRRATSPTTATGARPGRSPAGGRTGRSARTRTRRSTSTSRPIACPGTDVERTQRGLLRPPAPRAVRAGIRRAAARADAVRTEGGSLQAAAGDRRQHEPGRRPVRRTRAATVARRLDGPGRRTGRRST